MREAVYGVMRAAACRAEREGRARQIGVERSADNIDTIATAHLSSRNVRKVAMNDPQLKCPSAVCKPDAQILGTISNGVLAYDPSLPVVSDVPFGQVSGYGNPDKCLRFTSTCIRSRCEKWINDECALVEQVLSFLNPIDGPLPECGIRDCCRWFLQAGERVCQVCPLVVPDSSSVEHEDRSEQVNNPHDWAPINLPQ